MLFLRRVCLSCFCLLILAGAGVCNAHGGPPLRLGVSRDAAVSAIARLVLLHLREGVGFAVEWREFPDEAALRAAFAAGKIDLALGRTEEEPRAAVPPGVTDCPREALALLGEDVRRRWGGEPFLLGFSLRTAACAPAVLIVARTVLEDLRFGILAKEAGRVAALITPADVAAVRAAAASGGERAATAAARAALAAKARR